MRATPTGSELALYDLVNDEPKRLTVKRSDGDGGYWRGGVRDFRWIGPRRMLVDGTFLTERDVPIASGFAAVDIDGKNYVKLPGFGSYAPRPLPVPGSLELAFMFEWHAGTIFVPPATTDTIYVSGREGGWNGRPDVFKIDTARGTKKRLIKNPGGITDWLFAPDAQVIGIAGTSSATKVLRREGSGNAWVEIADLGGGRAQYRLLAYDSTAQQIYASKPGRHGLHAIYAFSLREKTWSEPLVESPRYDVAPPGWMRPYAGHDLKAPLFFARSGGLLGVGIMTDRPIQQWLNPRFTELSRRLNAFLPNRFNQIVSIDEAETRALCFSWSDRDPGVYAAIELGTGKVRRLVSHMGWLNPPDLCPVRPVSFNARDGIALEAYVTTPLGGEAGGLRPLVVLGRQAPWRREVGSFDPLAQFLATRGYVVMQVNYRGSLGYGSDFAHRGPSAIGGAIQDDLADGVRWAIAQGLVDPRRAAAVGNGFGGYCALASLARDGELFRCGVAMDAVVDWERISRGDEVGPYDRWFKLQELSVAAKTAAQWREISPTRFPERFRAPLLLIHNERDWGTPFSHVKNFAAAVKKNGGPVETFFHNTILSDFAALEHRQQEIFEILERFLTQHLSTEGEISRTTTREPQPNSP